MTSLEALQALQEQGYEIDTIYITSANQIERVPFDLRGGLLITGLDSLESPLGRAVSAEVTLRLGAARWEQRHGLEGCVYLEPAQANLARPFTLSPLDDVVKALRAPDGCPWDKLQTHSSLRRYFLEEVYEILDAIDAEDDDNLKEELGDVLLQIVFHARLAEERGAFTLQDVIDGICQKMIHRHPHVFSELTASDAATQLLSWEALKAQEKGHKRESILDGVSKGLPALLAAQKLQEKAAKVGFDWNQVELIWDKVYEEIEEFKAEVSAQNIENMEKEAGDVIFSLINLFRWYRISGENALNRTNTKFSRRFRHVEQCVSASGRQWKSFSLEELDTFWREAKVQEST